MSRITYSAFITLLKSGVRHTGYVESLGDVTWIEEPVHFAKIYRLGNLFSGIAINLDYVYASEKAAMDDYNKRGGKNSSVRAIFVWKELNEINRWTYQAKNFEIKTKKRYRMKITPNPIMERNNYYAVRDNVSIKNIEEHIAYIEKGLNFLSRQEKELASGLNYINSAIGNSGVGAALDVLGEFGKAPKAAGRFIDVLSCVSIVEDLDDGNYEDAAGSAFLFLLGKGLGRVGLGWVSTTYSVGAWFFETDGGKETLLRAEWNNFRKEIDKAKKAKTYYLQKKHEEKANRHLENFHRLADELGIPR